MRGLVRFTFLRYLYVYDLTSAVAYSSILCTKNKHRFVDYLYLLRRPSGYYCHGKAWDVSRGRRSSEPNCCMARQVSGESVLQENLMCPGEQIFLAGNLSSRTGYILSVPGPDAPCKINYWAIPSYMPPSRRYQGFTWLPI